MICEKRLTTSSKYREVPERKYEKTHSTSL